MNSLQIKGICDESRLKLGEKKGNLGDWLPNCFHIYFQSKI